MTDFADDAQLAEQRDRDAALASRRKPPVMERHITDECIACGEPISPERRAAIPDAARCAGCQSAYEAETARRAR